MTRDINYTPPAYASDQEKGVGDTKNIAAYGHHDPMRASFSEPGRADHTHRKLKARHIQLIGIGGTIGTALYVRTSVL